MFPIEPSCDEAFRSSFRAFKPDANRIGRRYRAQAAAPGRPSIWRRQFVKRFANPQELSAPYLVLIVAFGVRHRRSPPRRPAGFGDVGVIRWGGLCVAVARQTQPWCWRRFRNYSHAHGMQFCRKPSGSQCRRTCRTQGPSAWGMDTPCQGARAAACASSQSRHPERPSYNIRR